ncbi:MAG TPA: MarR family transcriptional regulator [Candidatus Limnocylindrales bacterium]|jgi:DNA-binding MarR family transcriptional regulator
MTSPNNDARPAVARALEAFEDLQRRLMAVHAPAFTAIDLTMAQAKLLYVVAATGELSMSEIAQRLGVSLSTASGAVDHLVSTGFLSRRDDPANRRQVRVAATAFGLAALEELRELSTRQLRALFALVSDPDLAVIEEATRILVAAASAAAEATATVDPSQEDDR